MSSILIAVLDDLPVVMRMTVSDDDPAANRARNDGTPDFHALRSRRRGHEAVLFAFDLIEHDDDDPRDLPLIDRKWRLTRLIGKGRKWRAIQFGEHLTGDGQAVFEHVCRMGLEGIVSKRVDAPYRSGPTKMWLKTKNPASARCAASVRRSGTSLGVPRPSWFCPNGKPDEGAITATLRTMIAIAACPSRKPNPAGT